MAFTEGLCGYSDGWRVPDIHELENLASLDRKKPTIDTDYFPNTPAWYFWSSSPYAYGPHPDRSYRAWYVRFDNGFSFQHDRDHFRHVRLVRSGQ